MAHAYRLLERFGGKYTHMRTDVQYDIAFLNHFPRVCFGKPIVLRKQISDAVGWKGIVSNPECPTTIGDLPQAPVAVPGCFD